MAVGPEAEDAAVEIEHAAAEAEAAPDEFAVAEPEWVEKLWWGKKVVGVRVRLADARSALVKELVRNAWTRKAPKRLSVSSGRR